MKAEVAFLCDGASPPPAWRGHWRGTQHLTTSGDRATVNFAFRNLEDGFRGAIDRRLLDLVRIGAYALAADQSVSRGGNADPSNRDWRRHLGLVVPVNDPDFWSSPDVARALRNCVGFASDDDWEFSFVAANEPSLQRLAFEDLAGAPGAEADVVIAFSGGADSLTAVVEQLAAGRRPILVSHRSATVLTGRRKELIAGLRGLFPDTPIGRVGISAHRSGEEPSESTMRSRSFLFASAASALAAQLHASDVLLADNGWVSVNPNINAQLVGALATRSTHPVFIRLFNALFQMVSPGAPTLRNPFWNQTRADVFARLREAGGHRLLPYTVSCAASRNLPRATPHCGRCSQCVDRRISSLASGLDDFDPADGYKFDVFRGSLPTGVTRDFAVSYVRAARQIENLSDDGILGEFDKLIECLTPGREEQDAEAYIAMLRRHSGGVLRVLSEQVGLARDAISRGQIPSSSLLALLLQESNTGLAQGGEFDPGGDYRTARWLDQQLTFTECQAAAIRNLHRAHLDGRGALSGRLALAGSTCASSKMSDVFKHHPAWKTLVISGGSRGTYCLNLSPKVA